MPAYLSQGRRNYNQVMGINSRSDPIAKLDYYVTSSSSAETTTSSSSAVSPTAQSQQSSFYSRALEGEFMSHRKRKLSADRLHGDYRQQQPAGDSGFTRQRRKVVLMADDHGQSTVNNQKFGSPLDTSGFSEGTQMEPSWRESFEGQPRGVGSRQFGRRQPQHSPLTTITSAIPVAKTRYHLGSEQQQPKLQVEPAPQQRATVQTGSSQAPVGQRLVKRRNLGRINRRQLVNGGSSGAIQDNVGGFYPVDPYALSELFSQSEIPGFREIFASDSYLRKFCWVVAFIVMTVFSFNDIIELVNTYNEYPISVNVMLRDQTQLPFPSVTVCNLNVVRFSALCSSTSSSHYDLTGMPPDMREKLCGVQKEEKNKTGGGGGGSGSGGGAVPDSELGDINNFGITTTTPMPSTTLNATQAAPGGEQSTRPMTGSSPAEHRGSSAPNNSSEATSPLPPPQAATQSQPPASSTRRQVVANGGLDLGDFADPALLVLGDGGVSQRRLPHSLPAGRDKHRKRSIRFSESELEFGEQQPRPFASSKSRLQLRPSKQTSMGRRSAAASGQQSNPGKLAASPPARHGVRTGPGPGQVGVTVPHYPTNSNNNNKPLGPNNNNNNNNNPAQSGTTTPPVTMFSPPALPEDFELTERQERELQENLTNWLAVQHNRDSKFAEFLGHQLDDMLLRCTMKHINCTHRRSFEQTFTPTEGNCFTYRSARSRRRPSAGGSGGGGSMYQEANLAGTADGLELVLNLEKGEYVSGSSQVGALVMIHHPSDLGYAASEATFVAPEYTTYIGLKMVSITRLPWPYPEKCIDHWPAKFADTLARNSTYSQQACLKICLQKTIHSHCQCQSALLPILELDGSDSAPTAEAPAASTSGQQQPTSKPPDPRLKICDTRKSQTRTCVREVMFRASDRVHNCECPPKCRVVRYDKTISMAKWPTKEDKVTFDRGKMDVNFQNLAKVIVYFQTMTCEEVTQQPVENGAKLFSNIGGIMGMYVGFSFLSLFEIVEVMTRKMWHHFMAKLNGSRLAEGVDFIETEEDAEAVESAVVKIQSTFRGKKIRSKLGQKSAANQQQEATNKDPNCKPEAVDSSNSKKKQEAEAEELNQKVAKMQVNDNKQEPASNAASMGSPEEEAERAATKIQAGFKGYKTRKELEGKLSQQQQAPAGGGAANKPPEQEQPK